VLGLLYDDYRAKLQRYREIYLEEEMKKLGWSGRLNIADAGKEWEMSDKVREKSEARTKGATKKDVM
jgi:hypothetical protein